MAKSDTTVKKKKKGIVQRMMFGDDTKPDLTPERMKMSKWAMFKHLFFHRFGTMVFLNLLTVLFALPAAAVMVLFYLNTAVAASFIPYSGNLGIGYPIVTDAITQGVLTNFSYELMEFLILVPCIAVFALGVSGNLYVMRKLVWEEPTRTFKDFFRGIKKCWLPALVMGFAFGLTILLVQFSFGYFDAYRLSTGLKALSITLSIIFLVFMILFASFFLTQNAAFKMRPMVLIRNSLLFVIGTNIQAILIIGLALAPVYLMFIPGIMMILVMVYVFLGVSFSTLGITLYCHHCYEKFLYDKIENKPSTVYAKRASDFDDEKTEQVGKKKQQPVAYKNPKKRKKSIDEGASITPLTPTFRREDLERLEKEHEKVMRESTDDDGEDSAEGDGEVSPAVTETAPTVPDNAASEVGTDKADGTDNGKE